MLRYFIILALLCGFLHAEEDHEQHSFADNPWVRSSSKVDLVIFSFDRPMQLYALLESCERYLTGLEAIQIIYRSSNDEFKNAYKIVKRRFSSVKFINQRAKLAGSDFKKLVVKAVFGAKARYVMFAVDDMVMTDFVDLTECISAMRKKRPWFFSLRLGKNIQLDTVLNIPCPPPKRKKYGQKMFSWKFSDGKGPWNYPNSVDMTIYRKKDVRYFLKHARYSNPNTLEGAWSLQRHKRKTGLAFNSSKAVNIPLNVVNLLWTSANMDVSVHDLLARFKNYEKIDINPLYKIRPYATHVPFAVSYVQRKDPFKMYDVSLSRPDYFVNCESV